MRQPAQGASIITSVLITSCATEWDEVAAEKQSVSISAEGGDIRHNQCGLLMVVPKLDESPLRRAGQWFLRLQRRSGGGTPYPRSVNPGPSRRGWGHLCPPAASLRPVCGVISTRRRDISPMHNLIYVVATNDLQPQRTKNVRKRILHLYWTGRDATIGITLTYCVSENEKRGVAFGRSPQFGCVACYQHPTRPALMASEDHSTGVSFASSLVRCCDPSVNAWS